jgi:hypothetical protein
VPKNLTGTFQIVLNLDTGPFPSNIQSLQIQLKDGQLVQK